MKDKRENKFENDCYKDYREDKLVHKLKVIGRAHIITTYHCADQKPQIRSCLRIAEY